MAVQPCTLFPWLTVEQHIRHGPPCPRAWPMQTAPGSAAPKARLMAEIREDLRRAIAPPGSRAVSRIAGYGIRDHGFVGGA